MILAGEHVKMTIGGVEVKGVDKVELRTVEHQRRAPIGVANGDFSISFGLEFDADQMRNFLAALGIKTGRYWDRRARGRKQPCRRMTRQQRKWLRLEIAKLYGLPVRAVRMRGSSNEIAMHLVTSPTRDQMRVVKEERMGEINKRPVYQDGIGTCKCGQTRWLYRLVDAPEAQLCGECIRALCGPPPDALPPPSEPRS